jgi:hypothetical protein
VDDPYPLYSTMREAGAVVPTPTGMPIVTRYEPVG